jgi:heptaprenyl diphosphate synthase
MEMPVKQKHSISSPSKPASHEKNRGDSFHNVKAGSGLLHNGLVSTEKLAFLAACCLFLSALDYLIPKPIPFMRIGLAHLPLLVSLPFLSLKPFLLLLGLKILVQGLIQGTLFSYVALFSVCGSITSGLVMFFIYKTAKKHISLIGVSMLGALINNLVQLLLAGLLLFKQAIWLIGPPFLILGSLSGFILGTFAQQFSQKSSWLSQFFAATKKRTEDQAPATVDKKQPVLPNPVQSHRPAGHTHTSCKLTLPSQMLLCGLLLIPAFLLHNHLILRLIQTGLFIGLALWAGKKIKYILSLCMGASLIIIHQAAKYYLHWVPFLLQQGLCNGG